MAQTITFTVNGQSRKVTADPDKPLLSVLREDLKLTGTKFGCGEGQCRACTVLLNGEPVASCITPVIDADKKEVLTIEGKDDTLHRVQGAFLAENAFQCGYCTAGMIVGTVALLDKTPRPTEKQIRAGLQKHICRCGTYPRIIKAVRRAAAQ
ncbi:MAG TPA: (2Fe-2S)-binding protein [Verrucomicrobiae bacterium]|nr:(2Fe-2S)-binding protein [Verrucomicrobiae bacterium]